MQSASSRIWTRVAVSIPYYDNHYTMSTTNNLLQLVEQINRFEFVAFIQAVAVSVLIYVFTQPLRHEQDATYGQFLCRV